jgi:hypothetical protein
VVERLDQIGERDPREVRRAGEVDVRTDLSALDLLERLFEGEERLVLDRAVEALLELRKRLLPDVVRPVVDPERRALLDRRVGGDGLAVHRKRDGTVGTCKDPFPRGGAVPPVRGLPHAARNADSVGIASAARPA